MLFRNLHLHRTLRQFTQDHSIFQLSAITTGWQRESAVVQISEQLPPRSSAWRWPVLSGVPHLPVDSPLLRITHWEPVIHPVIMPPLWPIFGSFRIQTPLPPPLPAYTSEGMPSLSVLFSYWPHCNSKFYLQARFTKLMGDSKGFPRRYLIMYRYRYSISTGTVQYNTIRWEFRE